MNVRKYDEQLSRVELLTERDVILSGWTNAVESQIILDTQSESRK